MTDHLDPIFVLAGLRWLHVRRAFKHLKEDGNIVALSILTVAVRVYFKSPSDAVRYKLR